VDEDGLSILIHWREQKDVHYRWSTLEYTGRQVHILIWPHFLDDPNTQWKLFVAQSESDKQRSTILPRREVEQFVTSGTWAFKTWISRRPCPTRNKVQDFTPEKSCRSCSLSLQIAGTKSFSCVWGSSNFLGATIIWASPAYPRSLSSKRPTLA
jgi:hypothetical protein